MSTHTPERATPEHISIMGWIARGLALVIFVPPRLAWEALKGLAHLIAATLRLFVEHLLEPLWILFRDWVYRPLRNFVRNYLWHWLIQQLLFGMVLTPLGAFLLAYFLRPIQRAIEEWLWRRVLKPAFRWTVWNVVAPTLLAIVWFIEHIVNPIITWLIIWPLVQLWRWVLRPLVHVVLVTCAFGWRMATTVVEFTVVAPCRWLNRTVLQPLFAAIARARHALAKPVRWAYRRVIMPWRARAAEVWTLIFGG
ncbi:hypothetical protein GPX89_24055 [Nocardia sp. ET3-3]|uniref:Uncharacterized protein n=1 Tax=Nocardia terrae TaxID=2675851 RepID=A0A7K1V1L3_9NOCA|nr:hypothetical protein [Nocardia terrae]MVU80309.1 hypothetical protein [Nocardia terrae]